jgi:hypothetical protein
MNSKELPTKSKKQILTHTNQRGIVNEQIDLLQLMIVVNGLFHNCIIEIKAIHQQRQWNACFSVLVFSNATSYEKSLTTPFS